MINLTLTKDEANLVWLAINQAEHNAWANVNEIPSAVKVATTLTHLRRELEYRQQLAKEEEEANNG